VRFKCLLHLCFGIIFDCLCRLELCLAGLAKAERDGSQFHDLQITLHDVSLSFASIVLLPASWKAPTNAIGQWEFKYESNRSIHLTLDPSMLSSWQYDPNHLALHVHCLFLSLPFAGGFREEDFSMPPAGDE